MVFRPIRPLFSIFQQAVQSCRKCRKNDVGFSPWGANPVSMRPLFFAPNDYLAFSLDCFAMINPEILA
jgi:hypothetical protein